MANSKSILFLVFAFLFCLSVAAGMIVHQAITATLTLILSNYLYFEAKTSKWAQFLLILIILILSLLMSSHIIPGFNNIKLLEGVQFSKNSVPYSFWINIDQIVVGYIIMFFAFKPAKTFSVLGMALKSTYKLFIIAILSLSILAMLFGLIKFEPKIPEGLLLWVVLNLFVTCIYEEAVFRLFLQNAIEESLKSKKWAIEISIFSAASLFGLKHYLFTGLWSYVIVATIAGIFYGIVYRMTSRIEMSILLHFLVNLTHIIAFTYPFSINML